MNHPDNLPSARPSNRLQFSLGSILTWTAILCLAVGVVMINRQLANLRQEVAVLSQDTESSRPLSVTEVADQFEKLATLGPIKTTVRDVRYSPEKDAFHIEFSWVDSNTSDKWSGSVELESNGYGKYFGQIRNGPFVEPLGLEKYPVVVESPSIFERGKR